MNYLNRLYRLVSITAILLLLLSCDSTLPQSREDVRSATNTVVSPSTTITSSVIPTATVSAFHMPRWTPWPKLPTEEILQAALTIYENNGGCQFPCVWGVTPGQTSLRSVHERFSPLSTKDSVTLSYNDVAHPHAVLTKGNNSYTYDATGNQTQRIIG
ncbi:MAG: hypothetical protein OEZ02_14425, partial [Anaerolineae bacterium]|nr:hypothetical protein [Anaerolineae bacterium]